MRRKQLLPFWVPCRLVVASGGLVSAEPPAEPPAEQDAGESVQAPAKVARKWHSIELVHEVAPDSLGTDCYCIIIHYECYYDTLP